MQRELVVNLIKISLLGLLALLLAVRIWQDDATERRLLDLRSALDRQEGLIRAIEERPAPAPTHSGSTDAPAPDPSDPRTLPYWPTEDNILADLSREPKPPADAPRGGTIRFYLQSNPRSLNEHTTSEAELQERISAPIYEKIADQSRADPDLYVPGICNRVTVNEDYTEFTCHVRKGMRWHRPYLTAEEKRGRLKWLADLPPQEVTAEDIKFTFDTVRDPLAQCGNIAAYLTDIESVEVVDRYTVRITWKRPLYYNKSTTLALLVIYPKFIFERDEDGRLLSPELVPTTFSQHWFNSKACGTGPWMFDGFEPNQNLRLKRNPDWWNPDKPAADEVYLRIVTDPTNRLQLFKAGEIDLLAMDAASYNAEVLRGGPGSVKSMIDAGEVTLKKWEMFAYYWVGWNLRNKKLQEKDVRQALAYLFPKERIIRDVYFGLARPALGPVHPWEPYFDEDLPRFEFDPEHAARLLDGAGWRLNAQGIREKVVEGERVELRIKILYPTSSPTPRDAVQLYGTAAKAAGVIIEPEPREWMQMITMLDDKKFEACMLGWGNSWDSDPSQIWHSESALSAKGSNSVSYINPEVDAIIEGLKTEFDPGVRRDLWKRFQRTIVEDQPYCFTFIVQRPWIWRKRLGNPYFAKLRPQDWLLPWFVKDGR